MLTHLDFTSTVYCWVSGPTQLMAHTHTFIYAHLSFVLQHVHKPTLLLDKKALSPKTNIDKYTQWICAFLTADWFHKACLFWKTRGQFCCLSINRKSSLRTIPRKPLHLQFFVSCCPLLDCSFKDLKELLQDAQKIIQHFYNPAWMCALERSFSHVHTRVLTSL